MLLEMIFKWYILFLAPVAILFSGAELCYLVEGSGSGTFRTVELFYNWASGSGDAV